jgi:hypothetical protein
MPVTVMPSPVPVPTVGSVAQTVLRAGGYDSLLNESKAQITSSFGSAAPYITSAAAGFNSSGAEEIIMVTSNPGLIAAALPTIKSGMRQTYADVKVTLNGAVLRMDIPASEVNA